MLTLGLLLGILVSLLIGAWPAIEKYGFSFFTSSVWDPVSEEFGGLVMPASGSVHKVQAA